MGRAHLSSQYGIDDSIPPTSPLHYNHLEYNQNAPRSPHPSILPKFLDRPFDLDAELPDGPDVVYEAFLTTTITDHNGGPIVVPPRTSAPSPVESIDTDEATTDAPTEPLTRVPTPAEHDPGHRTSSPSATGLSVLELMEPLSNARSAALPALREVVDNTTTAATEETAIAPLVQRLIGILRPHISSAIAPFRSTMPDVEFLGHMFERSLILDVLPIEPSSGAVFPRAAVLAALDAADVNSEEVEARLVDQVAEEQVDDDASDAVSDPGMDEEDLLAESISSTTRAPTNTSWSTWAPSASRSTISSLVNRIPRVSATNSRSTTPASGMDVDTDVEETSDYSSRGSPGPMRSVYRTSHIPSFAPRIVRATSARVTPYPPVSLHASGGGPRISAYHDRFVPVDRSSVRT